VILTFSNLNIHVSDFNLRKITFFKKNISLKIDFYEKLFKIASYLREVPNMNSKNKGPLVELCKRPTTTGTFDLVNNNLFLGN
jgi:hypothetical protein